MLSAQSTTQDYTRYGTKQSLSTHSNQDYCSCSRHFVVAETSLYWCPFTEHVYSTTPIQRKRFGWRMNTDRNAICFGFIASNALFFTQRHCFNAKVFDQEGAVIERPFGWAFQFPMLCFWWDIWVHTFGVHLRTIRFTPTFPKGGRGCLMSPPLSGIWGRSVASTLLSPLLFFCLVLLPFLSYRFLPAGPFF